MQDLCSGRPSAIRDSRRSSLAARCWFRYREAFPGTARRSGQRWSSPLRSGMWVLHCQFGRGCNATSKFKNRLLHQTAGGRASGSTMSPSPSRRWRRRLAGWYLSTTLLPRGEHCSRRQHDCRRKCRTRISARSHSYGPRDSCGAWISSRTCVMGWSVGQSSMRAGSRRAALVLRHCAS
jgi:hypothetical protein